jgi:hypothetical protein
VRYPKKRKIPTQIPMMMSGKRKNWAINKDAGFLTSVRSSSGGKGAGFGFSESIDAKAISKNRC